MPPTESFVSTTIINREGLMYIIYPVFNICNGISVWNEKKRLVIIMFISLILLMFIIIVVVFIFVMCITNKYVINITMIIIAHIVIHDNIDVSVSFLSLVLLTRI